jgi:hypothetical protein
MPIVDFALREAFTHNTQMQDTTSTLADRVNRLTHHNTILGCKIPMLLHSKDIVQCRNQFALPHPCIHIRQDVQNSASLCKYPILFVITHIVNSCMLVQGDNEKGKR